MPSNDPNLLNDGEGHQPATAAPPWHNPLPSWILGNPAYRDLKQGPQMTLQKIANRCDGRRSDAKSESLLVCIGGQQLVEQCSCSASTFWTHVNKLVELGFVVQLSNGGGHKANIYGIPGRQGELDEFRGSKGGQRGLWEPSDTGRIRRRLEAIYGPARDRGESTQNPGPLASKNRTAGVQKSDSRRPETGQQAPENRTLPSSSPSPRPSPLPSTRKNLKPPLGLDDDSEPTSRTVSEARVKLRAIGLSMPRVEEILADLSPSEVFKLVARCQGKATENAAGYLWTTFREDRRTAGQNAKAGKYKAQSQAINDKCSQESKAKKELDHQAGVLNAMPEADRKQLHKIVCEDASKVARKGYELRDPTKSLEVGRDRRMIRALWQAYQRKATAHADAC